MKGVGDFWGRAASWEVVERSVDDHVTTELVRVLFDGDDRPLWAICAPGDPPRPLCRHDHPTSGAAHCDDARAARRGLAAEARMERIARLPAPEGAVYVEHCSFYWRASDGGACPTCGAAGSPLTPRAVLERSRSLDGWWIRVERVLVVSAVADAGLVEAPGVRILGDTAALVPHGALPLVLPPSIGGHLAARLQAVGWDARVVAQRRGKGAA